MSILIKGMEMPKDKPLRIVLNHNGQLFVDHGTWYTEYETVEIPPHGRLIDADELLKPVGSYDPIHYSYVDGNVVLLCDITNAPTIIESEGE